MTNEVIIQRGLDLLNLMTLDTEAVWTALDGNQKYEMDVKLQQYEELAEAVYHTEDLEDALQHVVTITFGIIQFVDDTPELKILLFPEGEPDASNPPTLGIRRADLGDTENKRRAQLNHFVGQISNTIVNLRGSASAQTRNKEQHR